MEKLLCETLVVLAENEKEVTNIIIKTHSFIKKIDNIREQLVKDSDFESLTLFYYIDKDKKDFISSKDLENLLKVNEIECTEDELIEILKILDFDSDAKISYREYY